MLVSNNIQNNVLLYQGPQSLPLPLALHSDALPKDSAGEVAQKILFSNISATETETPAAPTVQVSPGEQAYLNVIRNLDEPTRALIESKLEKIDHEDIQILTTAIKSGTFKHKIFADADHSYYLGLAALRLGFISIEQFATISFTWSLRQSHKNSTIKSVSLFNDDGTVSQQARQIIRQTAATWPTAEYGLSRYGPTLLSEEQLDLFFEAMQHSSVPLSERQFFTFPDTRSDIPSRNDEEFFSKLLANEVTLTHAIMTGSGINVFSRFRTKHEKSRRMFASFTMMQEFLKVIEPENHVKIQPEISLAKAKDFEKFGTTQTRPMALSCPDKPLPKYADNIFASEECEIIYHDFFHAIIASAIPKHQQKAFIAVARLIIDLKSTLKNVTASENPSEETVSFMQNYLTFMFERVIDMEHLRVKIAGHVDEDNYNFWQCIGGLVRSCNDRFYYSFVPEAQRNIVRYTVIASTVESELVDSLSSVNVIRLLAERIVESRAQFEAMGIDFQVLHQLAQQEQALADHQDNEFVNLRFLRELATALYQQEQALYQFVEPVEAPSAESSWGCQLL